MAAKSYININFPFRDSPDGFFLDLNSTDDRAIKSDLMHLLLTRKGQRYFNPNFGTDLMKYIFEPNDNLTFQQVKDEVTNAVKKYLPKLVIKDISVTQSPDSDYAATIMVDYKVTEGVFETSDFVIINV
jgi:phage baseplate assembly protein W